MALAMFCVAVTIGPMIGALRMALPSGSLGWVVTLMAARARSTGAPTAP